MSGGAATWAGSCGVTTAMIFKSKTIIKTMILFPCQHHVVPSPYPLSTLSTTLHDLLSEYADRPQFYDDSPSLPHVCNASTPGSFMAGLTPPRLVRQHVVDFSCLKMEPPPSPVYQRPPDTIESLITSFPVSPIKIMNRSSTRLQGKSPTTYYDQQDSQEQDTPPTPKAAKIKNKEKLTALVVCDVCMRVFPWRKNTFQYQHKSRHVKSRAHQKARSYGLCV